jgi:hypothetical protein
VLVGEGSDHLSRCHQREISAVPGDGRSLRTGTEFDIFHSRNVHGGVASTSVANRAALTSRRASVHDDADLDAKRWCRQFPSR